VTRTVKDLVAGSKIGFSDRGAHALKGLDGDWELFDVVTVDGEAGHSVLDPRGPWLGGMPSSRGFSPGIGAS
jgi:hypothetical protein